MATIDGMNRRETARAIAFLSKEVREASGRITRAFKEGRICDQADLDTLKSHTEKITKWVEFWNNERATELSKHSDLQNGNLSGAIND